MLANNSLEDFATDLPLRLAVERALEIICEATRQISDNIKARQSAIDWQRMVDFGNLLRHAYHRGIPKSRLRLRLANCCCSKAFAERVVADEQES